MRIPIVLLSLALAAGLAGSVGCRQSGDVWPPGPNGESRLTSPVSGTKPAANPGHPENPSSCCPAAADGFLAGGRLTDLLPAVRAQAGQSGLAALCVRPDAGQGQIFLILAENQSLAGQLNGFFYWLDGIASKAGSSPLLLGMDKLFRESARTRATANGSYSEPDVVGLLGFSLRQILQSSYQPEILDFILTCYRREFARRLKSCRPSDQQYRKTFQKLEVTYEAAIYSSVSFRILPAAA